MPHTARKKKPSSRSNRKQIVDEDGWTRVTSNICPKRGLQPGSSSKDYASGMRSQGFQPYRLQGLDGDVSEEWPVQPAPAADDQTDDNLLVQYRSIERKWRNSDTCRALKSAMHTRVSQNVPKISTCIVFGTGTFSGYLKGWIDRHQVALIQLAAFLTVVDCLKFVQNEPLQCFAQEPHYNSLDTVLLRTLGITKVDHPTAFCLLNDSTFAYCPGAEAFVTLRSLSFDPAIWLGGELELYKGRGGRIYASATQGFLMQPDGSSLAVDGPEEENGDRNIITTERMRMQAESEIIERYVKGKQVVKLPDLDVSDHPMHKQHLYWREQA